jgi:hypothetical protein
MAQTNVQAFSGDVEITSNVTAASSKFSLDTNGTLKQIGAGTNNNYIKLMKYFASGSNWKIATGSYSGDAWQWLSIRAKMTRLSEDVEIIQFNYFGSGGISRVRDSIVIGGGNASTQASEIKVYNKTSNSTYEIYLQIDSATSVEVEITHRGSTIDDDYSTVATANNGAIDETGLTKIYDSGTTTDLRLKQGNVGIGTNAPLSSTKLETHGNVLFDLSKGDTIPTGLYNYMSTQLLIDGQVYLSRGTTTASTDIEPPPGVAGDVICKFVNSTNTEAIVQSIPINMPVTTGDTIYFGGWYYAPSNHITIQHWGGSGGGPSVNYIVAGDATWRWIERTVTATSTGTIGYRIDNDTAGGTIYITGLTVRKNPSQTTGLPFTPRYSPHDGIGSVFTTQNIVAKEAAIKTLTGNVGIGTNNPLQKLDLGDLGGGSIRLGRDHDDDNTSTNRIGRTNVGGSAWYSSINFIDEGTNDDAISFVTHQTGEGAFERMRISGNGNVGIGTTIPDNKLHVFGGTDTLYLEKSTYGGGVGIKFNDDIVGSGLGAQHGFLRFYHQNTESFGAGSSFRFSSTEDTEALVCGGALMIGVDGKDMGVAGGARKSLFIQSTYGGNTSQNYGWWIGGQNGGLGPGDNDLHFAVVRNGVTTSPAYIQDDEPTETRMNFTGQHRTFIKDVPFSQAKDLEGLIVSSDQNKYIKMSGGIEAGSNAITTNESLPVVSLSTTTNDKKCFGVISASEDPERRQEEYGSFVSVNKKEKGDTRVYINSVGEGAIWVSNIGGNLESGDYITTSNVAGYGQKQTDDVLHNFTVAKITMDCDFEPVTQPIQIIRKEMGDVNYWVKTTYENVTEEEYSNLVDENRQIVDGVYQKITKEESETEQEGWELEVRQELVNALDEHGQIQWEDHPTETEKAYKIRYLDASGVETDEENAVHIAAFVGCTYHCG